MPLPEEQRASATTTELLHSALATGRMLVEEHVALFKFKLRDGARAARRGAIAMAAAAILAIVAAGQITYAVAGWLIARRGDIQENALVMAAAAALSLALAGIAGYVAVRSFHRAFEAPKSLVLAGKEDKSWSTTG